MASEAAVLKDEGNSKFTSGDFDGALSCYTRALKLCDGKEDEKEKAVYYKNRAAAYLKLEKYQNAVNDCTAALDIQASDVKALFRRCQAYEKLENYNEAFKDAKKVHHIEPTNKAIEPVLRRLSAKLQDIAKEQASTSSRGKQMFEILLDEKEAIEKREQAANNIFVLAKEKAGAEFIVNSGGILKILSIVNKVKSQEIFLSLIRVFGELCKNSLERTKLVLKQVGVELIVESINSKSDQLISAVQYVIQTILNTLSGSNPLEGKKVDKILMKDNEKLIDELMGTLVKRTNSRIMSAKGRDGILEVLMKNVDYEQLNWGMKLIEAEGLMKLMEVASELEEVKYESSIDITENTRTNLAVTLDRVYWCMDCDKSREIYRNKVMEYINEKLRDPEIEAKVRITAAITTLLQGPIDVGNVCLGQAGVVEMMLVMAGTDDHLQQRVAAEAIISAASKKDKCSSIVSMGTDILKKLYMSKDDSIKVRALVGLCKVGSLGGTDASIKPFADGSNMKLAQACRKFLINPKKDKDLRRWAAEGLSYLTLDAEVKEELIEDANAITALIELAKTGNKACVYGVVTTLVNLTNSYDKQEIMPELVQLAKFAKQHIPEEHIKDKKEFIDKRVKVLAELGVSTGLVALSNTDSKNCKELIARVFNSICEQQELRGSVVQQGGAKVLVKLALDNTEKGKLTAAQALSRIAITINPETAFPGQRAAEVVRPIMALLHPDCSGLENFEALMALCNLAQVSPSIRTRILSDSGYSKIENYMFEDHVEIKRAATQCVVNLMFSDHVVKLYEGENDRVKYLVILSEDDDYETAKAASGALAMLLSVSKKCCKKVFDAKTWHSVLTKLTASEDKDLMHRGVCIVSSLVESSKEAAEKIVETNILEILMALTRPEVPVAQKIKDMASKTLVKAEDWKVIQKPIDLNEDD